MITWNLQEAREDDEVFVYVHKNSNTDSIQRLINQSKSKTIYSNFLFKGTKLIKDDLFFDELSKKLSDHYPINFNEKFLVGITGTNGKTSVASLCSQLLELHGKKSFTIGTLGALIDGDVIETEGTTPPFIDLWKLLHQGFQRNDYCFAEVSSHGLSQRRLGNFKCRLTAWTNFGQDHLDYHLSLDDYFSQKKKLLDDHLRPDGVMLLSADMKEHIGCFDLGKVKLLNEDFEFKGSLPQWGKFGFNYKNIILASEIVKELLQCDLDESKLSKLRPVIGRFNLYQLKEKKIIIDYAHTPDALISLIQSTKALYPKESIALVMGCGGDRDQEKREKMGEIASNQVDYLVLTNDNPRSEEPMDIINDIERGLTQKTKYSIELDRKKAIQKAVDSSLEFQVIIVAGKGHEEYQEIEGQKYELSDKKTILNLGAQKIDFI